MPGKKTLRGTKLELEKALSQEWLLTNGLGGYSSSTVIGLNTRKYHGLLVSADASLERTVVLQKLEEEIEAGKEVIQLAANEYADGRIYPNGNILLKEFACDLKHASFKYSTGKINVEKKVQLTPLKNTVVVSYNLQNKSGKEITFKVIPLGNIRSFHKLGEQDARITIQDEKTIKVATPGKEIILHSDKAKALSPPYPVNQNILYRLERSRGEDYLENVACWGAFSYTLGAGAGGSVSFACADTSPLDPHLPLHTLSSISDSSPLIPYLEGLCRTFIVYKPPWKTVIAGYHWFSEWSRDALISLPGLTLVWNNPGDAEAILRRFFYLFRDGRLATNTEDSLVTSYDFDGALWLVDRLNQYLKYVGLKAGKKLVIENMRVLTEIMRSYSKLLLDGIIQHSSGTWMDTLGRDNAVEVQVLCYNAAQIYCNLLELYDLKAPKDIDLTQLKEPLSQSFMDKFWVNGFLRDTTQYWESSVRPNHLIASALDYTMLSKKQMAEMLPVCEEKLLTAYGLRTLERSDSRYRGQYMGNSAEREQSYHNGSIWPWLIGPYVKTYVRVHGKRGRREMKRFLEGFFEKTFCCAGIGYVSELFDGEPPHAPRGCIAQAWSVAEPVRAYIEDVLDKKPGFESEVLV